MADDGSNPFRHACGDDGANCYVRNHKPRIELLAPLLPARCAFTDIDGLFERGGRFLFLEWKGWSRPRPLSRGQEIAYRGLVDLSDRICVVVALGDPLTMEAHHVRWFHRDGSAEDWRACSGDAFRRFIKARGERFNVGR
jgi:hypothetical protein